MLTKIRSVANIGLETVPVDVEVDVAAAGFPGFTIVGLASKAVEEARERVKTAIVNSGLEFPPRKITVNLAPADLPKDGAAYDLPMAVGVLLASGQITIPKDVDLTKTFFAGELSLDGALRPTRGILLLALFAQKQGGGRTLFVPALTASEASVVSGVKVFPVNTLKQLVEHLGAGEKIAAQRGKMKLPVEEAVEAEFDLAEIAGQEQAKRALIIAAAGGHNLLMWGPPGTGKTMLARALPGILPPLSGAEALEVTRVYSVAGLLNGKAIITTRPFRAPHHGVSAAGLIGGGSSPLPGEVSLAHLGVLFLDEMPQFPRSVLESLRAPLEDGTVEIVRAAGHVRYPASFTLVAAINPCPCGFLGHPKRECKCSERQIAKYRGRMSGPILDRIDLFVPVSVVETEKLALTNKTDAKQMTSRQGREQVGRARKTAQQRLKVAGIYTNSQMRNREVKTLSRLTSTAENLLKVATEKFNFSARSYMRLIKVARTIADLENATEILPVHMAEALQYRQVS